MPKGIYVRKKLPPFTAQHARNIAIAVRLRRNFTPEEIAKLSVEEFAKLKVILNQLCVEKLISKLAPAEKAIIKRRAVKRLDAINT